MAKSIAERAIDKQGWLDEVADMIQPALNSVFDTGGDVGRIAKDFLNGVWLGHPLHPVITDVPIGAWTITELLDLMSAANGDDEGLDRAADISLGAGLVAAEGTRRRMGLAHAMLNVLGLGLNIGSLLLRQGTAGGKRGRGAARALSAAGYISAALAAYIAGDLIYTKGQAVSRNAFVEGPDGFKDVADEKELEEGKMHRVEVDGQNVVLVKHDHGIHAFGGTCSHYGCGLWEGELEEEVVTCQCHGSQFDITDGSVVHGPAVAPVPSYEVKTQIGRVMVKIED